MVSYDGFTRFPAVSFESRQESSYDRRSKEPGTAEWFANDDGWGYIRMEYPSGREEKVIFDEQHPGVITRMWLTSFGSPETIVRFYFDGAEEPSWVVNSFNLKEFATYASSSLGDALAQPSATWNRGSSLYLPIPYAKSCKITIEELKDPITVSRYYHINYRRYPDDTEIETLSPAVFRKYQASIQKTNSVLEEPEPVKGESFETNVTIASAGTGSVELPSGMKSLNSLFISVRSNGVTMPAAKLQDIIIGAAFDGYQTLAVPLTELAGTGSGGYSNNSWRFSSTGRGAFDIRWMMPWQHTGSLLFRNNTDSEVTISISAVIGDYSWDERSMYFHGAYHETFDEPIKHWSDYAGGVEWNFATISGGRGVYSGDVFTINNHTNAWPGEGDEKIWVDEESFPSHFGTGVEDYFSFCGYFRYNTPFSGEPRLDSSSDFHGYHVYYRTRNLDAIPFRNKLKFQLEMQGHQAGTADVGSSFFWYGDPETKPAWVIEYVF